MTTAQTRSIKELATEKDALMDALVAILTHQGGVVRIPWNVMQEATRQPIRSYVEDGEFVIALDRVPMAPKSSRLRRFLRG